MKQCYYCKKTDELRPYGPKGAWVCFTCAFETQERKVETERNFLQQVEAAGPSVVIGEEVGPYPLKSRREEE